MVSGDMKCMRVSPNKPLNTSLLSTNTKRARDKNKKSSLVGCFNFAQMKASVELCINMLSDVAAKSELKANWEKFDSELG